MAIPQLADLRPTSPSATMAPTSHESEPPGIPGGSWSLGSLDKLVSAAIRALCASLRLRQLCVAEGHNRGAMRAEVDQNGRSGPHEEGAQTHERIANVEDGEYGQDRLEMPQARNRSHYWSKGRSAAPSSQSGSPLSWMRRLLKSNANSGGELHECGDVPIQAARRWR